MSGHDNPATAVRSWTEVVCHLFRWLWWPSQGGYPRKPMIRRSNGNLTGQIKGMEHPIAYGRYCDVWKCTWITNSESVEVAVKSIRVQDNVRDSEGKSERINTAIDVWLRLDHDNIVSVFGMTLNFSPLPAVVCPWMKNGTLTHYLEHHHHQTTAQIRKGILLQVVSGLHYLHDQGVIHGSLSGSNVFIDDRGRACLADYGMASLLMEFFSESYFSTSFSGAVRWTGPELFQTPDQSGKSADCPSVQGDVYSFGCIMLQVLSGKIPYYYLQRDAQVFFAISAGVKPVRPDGCCVNDAQWNIIQQCWLPAGQRPPVWKLHSDVNKLQL